MISAADRRHAVELIDEARAKGARLSPACETLGLSARTVQRWTQEGGVRADQRPLLERPKPANALTPDEEQAILEVCHRPAFASLPPEQIVARLLDEEQRYLASVSSVYRVLRRHGELTHRGRAKAPVSRPKPTTFHATAPNQVWSWDCTWLPGPAKGLFFYLVMILDVYSRKVVGWEVFHGESAHNAAQVIRRAVLAEGLVDQPLVLHADNGSPFKGATLLETLHALNITPSYSRPRVSNDNAFSEALFRTCKYVPDYPVNGFERLQASQRWVQNFIRWYNREHRHSAIRFVTPEQRHRGEDRAILAQRHALNQAARDKHPERWGSKTRNWDPIELVSLNPEREPNITPVKMAA
jgi:transposase InsO family protein